MDSDIRNIQWICKYGAFGNPDAAGFWVYGKRKDGKTVACKNRATEDGGIIIWSEYFQGDDCVCDSTELSASEWSEIKKHTGYRQKQVANQILDSRSS